MWSRDKNPDPRAGAFVKAAQRGRRSGGVGGGDLGLPDSDLDPWIQPLPPVGAEGDDDEEEGFGGTGPPTGA